MDFNPKTYSHENNVLIKFELYSFVNLEYELIINQLHNQSAILVNSKPIKTAKWAFKQLIV